MNRYAWIDPRPLLAMWPETATAAELAAACGVTRRTIVRWRNGHTRLTVGMAEGVADRLGVHPAEIWGPDYWKPPGYLEPRACLDCGEVKDAEDMRRNKGRVDGFGAVCVPCDRARNTAYRLAARSAS